MTRDLTNAIGEWGMGVVPHPITGTPGALAETQQCVRALNHLLANGGHLPAPTVYRMLADVVDVLSGLEQALDATGGALVRSLGAPGIVVTNTDGSDPVASAYRARHLLQLAASHLLEARNAANGAWSAIGTQQYEPVDNTRDES